MESQKLKQLYQSLVLKRDLSDPDTLKADYEEIKGLSLKEKELKDEDLYRFYQLVLRYDFREICELIRTDLFISLTSFPKRLSTISKTLETLFAQTVRCDRIVLWLTEEEFENKESQIPAELKAYVKAGKLSIEWSDLNLRPHNKYYHSMHKYPDSIIVTVDDDLYYPEDLIEKLYLSYLEYPKYVSASRVHLMMFDKEEKLIPYVRWIKEVDYCIHKPAMQLFATGTGGVLYPPHILDESLIDYHVFNDFCPTADDYWLKVIELLSDVPVVLARKHSVFGMTEGSQEVSLLSINVMRNGNDKQIKGVYKWIDETYHKDMIAEKVLHSGTGEYLNDPDTVIECLIRERRKLKLEIDRLVKENKELKEKQPEKNKSILARLLNK